MKKLAGTKWGANTKILQQVYTGNARSVMEYGSAGWTTAAPTNTARLDKVQNASMRLITGGLKTTPVNTLQTATGLLSPEHKATRESSYPTRKAQKIAKSPSQQTAT